MLDFSVTSASTGPWARIDGRTGIMVINGNDGEKTFLDLKGKVLSLDILNSTSGWLFIGPSGADWQPVEGAWGNPPTGDHRQGVSVKMYSAKDFGDAPIRTGRGNSRAWNSWIAEVKNRALKDGPLPTDKWVTLRVDAVTPVKLGQGSSIDFAFTLAPRDKWASPEGSAAPVAKPKAKAAEPIGEISEF